MSLRIETIAGQPFITMTGTDGRKRTLSPLATINAIRANITDLQAKRAAVEVEATGIVAAMRKSLAEGTDTTAHRDRMAELKRLDLELNTSVNAANQQITHVRAAAARAEADNIAATAQATITATLQPLDIGEYQ